MGPGLDDFIRIGGSIALLVFVVAFFVWLLVRGRGKPAKPPEDEPTTPELGPVPKWPAPPADELQPPRDPLPTHDERSQSPQPAEVAAALEQVTRTIPVPPPNPLVCVVCGNPPDPIGFDSELWEQVGSRWGRLLGRLDKRAGVEPGRDHLATRHALCLGCGRIAHRGNGVFQRELARDDAEYAAGRAARQQRWDEEGLLDYVRRTRDDERSRYAAAELEKDRKRGRVPPRKRKARRKRAK